MNERLQQDHCLLSVLLVVLLSACSSSSSDSRDADSDLIEDAVDNCPFVYNLDQIASIENHMVPGDIWMMRISSDIVYATDNCPLITNADQLDTDSKWVTGIYGSCEELALVADI